MGFNYERGAGPMLESFGHRVESHLKQTWSRKRREDNLWEQFILYDGIAPGRANCGWMHYAPNSLYDYDWGNPSVVPSNCDDWLYFPDFQGIVRQVDSREWGGGDMRAHVSDPRLCASVTLKCRIRHRSDRHRKVTIGARAGWRGAGRAGAPGASHSAWAPPP